MNYASYVRVFIIVLTFAIALVSISALILTERAIKINRNLLEFSLEIEADLLAETLDEYEIEDMSSIRPYFDLISFDHHLEDSAGMITAQIVLNNGKTLILGRKSYYIDELNKYKNIITIVLIFILILEFIAIFIFTNEKVLKPYKFMGELTGSEPSPEGIVDKFKKMVLELEENKKELEDLYEREKDKVIRITERSTSVLDNLRVGVIDVDIDGRIRKYNSVFSNMFEKSSLSENIYLLSSDLPESLKKSYLSAIEEKKFDTFNINLYDKIYEVIVSPVYEMEKFSGISFTIYDITEPVYLERIVMTKEKIKSLGEMSAGIAHEFRNSAGVILASAKLLSKKYSDKSIDILLDETTSLMNTIEKFLQLIRSDKIKFERYKIEELLREISKNYNWEFRYNSSVEFIESDRDLLRRALINLLKNSIENGSSVKDIFVNVSEDDNWYKIVISDKGHGIEEHDIDKLKAPFYSTKNDGIGLGLSLIEKIMDLHNGSLDIIPDEIGLKVVLRWRKNA